jgi:hypothetical protein
LDQKFDLWQPLPGLGDTLYVEAVLDDWEGFRILLRPHDPQKGMLRIAFENPYAYRNMNESYRLETWSHWPGPAPAGGSGLFLVRNSSWLSEFHSESQDVYRDQKIVHYAIFSPEDCVEVLSVSDPRVEWL